MAFIEVACPKKKKPKETSYDPKNETEGEVQTDGLKKHPRRSKDVRNVETRRA